MARLPRWIPEGALVELSCRTIQGRFLLKPTMRLCELFIGALGKACQEYGIKLHAVVALSTHWHALATVPSTGALAWAMRFFLGNLSKEAGRLFGWRGKLWATRYHCSIVDDDEATQISRLIYLLSAGCKEGLVWRPRDWPGVHSARALTMGLPLQGLWVSRRDQWAAKNRKGADSSDEAHSEPVRLDLAPLPCWAHLPEARWRRRVAELIEQIERETREGHERARTRPLGATKVLRVHPHHRPENLPWSPQPLIIARGKRRRIELWKALGEVVAAFIEASHDLARGDRAVRFPQGTFPPGLPYVPTTADLLRGG